MKAYLLFAISIGSSKGEDSDTRAQSTIKLVGREREFY